MYKDMMDTIGFVSGMTRELGALAQRAAASRQTLS